MTASDKWRNAIESEPAIFQYFLLEHGRELLEESLTEEDWEKFVGAVQDDFAEATTELLKSLWIEWESA